MPSVRFAQTADAAAINSLMTRVVGGQTIIQELLADFGTTGDLNLARYRTLINDSDTHVLLGFDDALVLRGVVVAQRDHVDGGFHVMLIATDKRLSDALRIDAMRLLLDWLTRNVAAVTDATRIWGIVKEGGKIDTFMIGKLSTRIVGTGTSSTGNGIPVGQVKLITIASELRAAVA